MDGAEHTAYRELLDPFFSPNRIAQLAPVLAAEAKDIVRRLSTVAMCAGVIMHWLEAHSAEQSSLVAATDADLDAAIDETLRLDDPLVMNRCVATTGTTIGGCPVATGEKPFFNWRTANVDPEAFDDPHAFDPVGNASRNVVYGTGAHVCPGRPLANPELRILVRAVLAAGTVAFDPRPSGDSRITARRGLPNRVGAAASDRVNGSFYLEVALAAT